MRAAPLLASLVALLPITAVAQTNGPPQTRVRVVTDTVAGTIVQDPYRWLDNVPYSAMLGWLHAQDDYTRHLLNAIPGRAALAARIHTLSNASAGVGGAQLTTSRVFYFKRLPREEVAKLYVRDSLAATERLVVDPEKLRQPGGNHWSLDYFTPSWDGRYVAYGVSPAGSENSILRVLDVSSGQVLPDSIDRAQFGAASWRPDGRSFFYNRLQKLASGAPATDHYRKSRAYLHTLGQPDSADVPILGIGVSSRVPLGGDDFPFFLVVASGPTWGMGCIAHGVLNGEVLDVAVLPDVPASPPPWRRLLARTPT